MTTNVWLSLVWLAAGAVIGALVAAARLDRAHGSWGGRRPLAGRAWIKIVIGALSALLGGWLGDLVFGKLFSTATALWVSVFCAAALPWLLQRGWRRAPKSDVISEE